MATVFEMGRTDNEVVAMALDQLKNGKISQPYEVMAVLLMGNVFDKSIDDNRVYLQSSHKRHQKTWISYKKKNVVGFLQQGIELKNQNVIDFAFSNLSYEGDDLTKNLKTFTPDNGRDVSKKWCINESKKNKQYWLTILARASQNNEWYIKNWEDVKL